MTRRNAIVIFNPAAGRIRRKRAEFDRAMEVLRSGGIDVTLVPTTGPRTGGRIAREHVDRGCDLVIACGGDGSINEIAEGIAGTGATLGILPGGTANVFAHEIGLSRRMDRAAAQLVVCEPRTIAVGRITSTLGPRNFLLMAGVGFDALVVYELSLPLKKRLGKLGYWLAAARHLTGKLEEFEVTIGSSEHRCSFALVSRVRNYGGDVEIATGASLLRDDFEVVLFSGTRARRYVLYFLGIASRRLGSMRGVRVERCTRVKIGCAPESRVHMQVDGEYAGPVPAEIELVPGAVRILLPREFTADARQVSDASPAIS